MSSKITYSVIVRNPNSWTQNEDGSNREYEITAHCGHKHQTETAAEACKDRLTAWYCICGERSDAHHRRCSNGGRHSANSTSAKWYQATVEASNAAEVKSTEADDRMAIEDAYWAQRSAEMGY